ncbi:MAG: hypothetical protein ACFCBW_06335, partial [Candidatus Competibacterales bacterium]
MALRSFGLGRQAFVTLLALGLTLGPWPSPARADGVFVSGYSGYRLGGGFRGGSREEGGGGVRVVWPGSPAA